jgi:hypothetical protein
MMSGKLSIPWRCFKLPKRGNQAEEYEDAFAGESATGRFAVADGASESSFAGVWARLLVQGFVTASNGDTPAQWLKPVRERWAAEVDPLPLPWFAEEKREQGAFATFLGMSFEKASDGPGGRWTAHAVGDSCLFQVRADKLIGTFPISRSSDFGTNPSLICSRPSADRTAASSPSQKWGSWELGDLIFLMTDAAAQWFLRRHERDRQPWESLFRRFRKPDADALLTTFFEKMRDADELRNDDITILLIRFDAKE